MRRAGVRRVGRIASCRRPYSRSSSARPSIAVVSVRRSACGRWARIERGRLAITSSRKRIPCRASSGSSTSRRLRRSAQGVAIGELRDAAARGEAQDVGVEQFAVAGVGLEHHLVDVRVLAAGSAPGPTCMRDCSMVRRVCESTPGRPPSAIRRWLKRCASATRSLSLPGLNGTSGLMPEHQIDVALQHHRGMHGPAQRAVDDMPGAPVLVAQSYRRIQAGQGGTGLHRLRDRHVVPAVVAEAHRLAAVEVHADDVERALQRCGNRCCGRGG